MADWPAAPFPQVPLVEGYDEAAPSTAVRTKMDAGPPKVRRRYTAGVRNVGIMLDLTKAQVETLDAFYISTLHGGVDRFNWEHPRTGATVSFRFVDPPAYRPLDPDVWRASVTLELLP